MDAALLLLRLIVGALMIGHGTQKLLGWFGGHGPEGTARFFASLGYRRTGVMARLGGLTEAGAGMLLMLGFLTPLATAALFGLMLNVIIAGHAGQGLWITNGGYEYPLVLATTALFFGMAGPGDVSLDAALDLVPSWWTGALFTIVIGGLAALVALMTRRPPPAEQPAEREPSQDSRQAA